MHNLKHGFLVLGLVSLLGLSWGKSVPAEAKATTLDQVQYNRKVHLTGTIYRTKYGFYKQPYKTGMKRIGSAKHDYEKKVTVTRAVKNGHGLFWKTKYGWINHDAFYKWVRYQGGLNYAMKVNHAHVAVYNKPWGLKGAQVVGSTSSKHLTNHWYHVDQRRELNTGKGYYRLVASDGKKYWIQGKYMTFNTQKLAGNLKKVEHAINTGSKLVGKSKYAWGGGRTTASIRGHHFDCSSFIHYIYAQSGVRLGSAAGCTTYSLIHMGRKVKASNMKRGDIFFFNDRDEGKNCHVAIYLGNHLFLHDSPSSDTGGVGISSLNDPHWKIRFNHSVRRIVG